VNSRATLVPTMPPERRSAIAWLVPANTLALPLSQTEQAPPQARGLAIQRAGASFPHLRRGPYGAFNATTHAILRLLTMLVVQRTVDTSGYTCSGVPRIVCTAVSGSRPGAIILMHDGGGNRSDTVAAFPRIIAAFRRHGNRLVTVSQRVADDPPPVRARACPRA
jgi:peptidoglycan/xylan/chitin deacetylase (PgdA/CDA1 family)